MFIHQDLQKVGLKLKKNMRNFHPPEVVVDNLNKITWVVRGKSTIS